MVAVGDEIAVIRDKRVVMARVRRVNKHEFFWRGNIIERRPGYSVGGGLGRCLLSDEGLTWAPTHDERVVAAFRVGVAL
jgi:hypothetical protein